MKLTKTTKIGIWVIICLIVLIWGINFLKGRDIFRTEAVYYARYKDVGGLTSSTIVALNGFKIGYVREIYFAKDLSGDLIVKLAIYNNFPLPFGTTAEIASTDLLGSRIVKINLGNSEQKYQPNDTLKAMTEIGLKEQVSEQLTPIRKKAERLLVSLDSIVLSATKILNPATQHDITQSIEQIRITMTNLGGISKNLNEIINEQKGNLASTINNINEITANIKRNSEILDHIMLNLSSFSDTLSKIKLNETLLSLNSSISRLDLILKKINSAEGSLGLLVNDPALYQNLNHTGENLNRLLIDFQRNPKRYVHFSAVDLGKEVIVAPTQNTQFGDSVIFKVFLFSSANPIAMDSPLLKGFREVEEQKSGRHYEYFTGHETSYNKIRMILDKVQSAFPEASLQAFRNGEKISLKKALKTISK
jgi:phospholipid/cholesterol/gamma-HCH transport system substrate-binding protein